MVVGDCFLVRLKSFFLDSIVGSFIVYWWFIWVFIFCLKIVSQMSETLPSQCFDVVVQILKASYMWGLLLCMS